MDPEQTWVSNSSSTLPRGPLLKSRLILDGIIPGYSCNLRLQSIATVRPQLFVAWLGENFLPTNLLHLTLEKQPI